MTSIRTSITHACCALMVLSMGACSFTGSSDDDGQETPQQQQQSQSQDKSKDKSKSTTTAANKKNDKEQKRAPVEKTFPLGSAWTVVRFNNKTYTGERPTMTLDRQYRMQGFAGCNTYSATSYPLRMQRIAVGPIAFTKKKCAPAVLASEKSFLVAMRGVYQWDIVGPQLILKSSDGEIVFERTL